MIKLDEAPERVRGCCVQLAAALPDRTAQNLVVVYKALADETRVQMLHMLKAAREPICVSLSCAGDDCSRRSAVRW